MTARKKGLGRGLDALLSPRARADDSQSTGEEALLSLPIDKLQRGRYQPRTHMDEAALSELADSIKAQGLVQPIVVRPVGKGNQYEIIAGERRWRAAQMAGLHEIPVVVRQVPDQAAMCIALIENIQRQDLNCIDEAVAYFQLMQEFSLTQEEIAKRVG
ncbi:MAG: ParB/RepB/Spo0J family partition protein, partial [Gammaproteobacteria bacterium]|nr:ParB/RepB/Spo0J family partition protein [Gammaproteobacteria bacterium]